MAKTWKNRLTVVGEWLRPMQRVPGEQHQAFILELLRDNNQSLRTIFGLLYAMELFLLLISDRLFGVRLIILIFIGFLTLMIPLLTWTGRIIDRPDPTPAARRMAEMVVIVAMAGTLLFGIAVTIKIMPMYDTTLVYFMVVIAIAGLQHMTPVANALLFCGSGLLLSLLLPLGGKSEEIMFVHRLNTSIFLLVAWAVGMLAFRRWVQSFLDRLVIQEKNAKLEEAVRQDQMTGLLNHVHAYRAVLDGMEWSREKGRSLCLILADIDNFKLINDTYGHLAGDEVIRILADAMRRIVRRTDAVGRYGGEEFVLILPDMELKAAEQFAERLRQAIAEAPFPKEIHVTLSGGIVQWSGESVEDLIRLADQRLYVAKNRGKDQFVSASDVA